MRILISDFLTPKYDVFSFEIKISFKLVPKMVNSGDKNKDSITK